MTADKLPEWPPTAYTPEDEEYWIDRVAFWEQRCRLAVEALEAIDACIDLAKFVSQDQFLARRTLEALGPLPPKEQP